MAGNHWINGIIGVRYKRNCHPDDLWKTYFTSSKYVQEYRKEHGEPDIIEIRQTFNDSLQAREWEHKVLRRLKVIQNDKWLNKGDGLALPPRFGINHNYSALEKMSVARKIFYENSDNRYKASELRRKVLKENPDICSGENNGMFGKKHSEITRKKLSEKRKKRVIKNSTRQLLSNNMKGKMWITDGCQSKMIQPVQWIVYEQEGWRKGRTVNPQ